MVEYAGHHTQIGETAAALSVAIPVAIYVFTLWLIRDRYVIRGATRFLMPASALLVLAAGAYASAQALPLIAAILVITLLLRGIAARTQ